MSDNKISEIEQLSQVAKAANVMNEIIETLVKHECSSLEARELLKGAVETFEEAIQKHPDKMNEPLKKDLFKP